MGLLVLRDCSRARSRFVIQGWEDSNAGAGVCVLSAERGAGSKASKAVEARIGRFTGSTLAHGEFVVEEIFSAKNPGMLPRTSLFEG